MTAAAAILDHPMPSEPNLANELADGVSGETLVRRDEPLAPHTTLRVGGPAALYVEPASETDLAAVLKFCRKRGLKFFVLGRGSNVLVRDGGFRGVVIRLVHPEFSRITVQGDRLHCGAGARLKQVVAEAKRHGLGGLEFLDGIPGSVGGALRMNAGAWGGATFDVVRTIRVMDPAGTVSELAAGQLPVAYRCCALLREHIALAAVLQGRPAPREEIERRLTELNRRRWEAQPAAPSAGCMFKNPVAVPAGRLIEELGLKGCRVGGAMVSLEHGNFFVNTGTATARDFLTLIERVQQRARAERGIELETEVEIISDD